MAPISKSSLIFTSRDFINVKTPKGGKHNMEDIKGNVKVLSFGHVLLPRLDVEGTTSGS